LSYNFFAFQGNIALEKSSHKKPFSWIPDIGWEDSVRLAFISPDVFGTLLQDIEKHEKDWKQVCLSDCRATKSVLLKYR